MTQRFSKHFSKHQELCLGSLHIHELNLPYYSSSIFRNYSRTNAIKHFHTNKKDEAINSILHLKKSDFSSISIYSFKQNSYHKLCGPHMNQMNALLGNSSQSIITNKRNLNASNSKIFDRIGYFQFMNQYYSTSSKDLSEKTENTEKTKNSSPENEKDKNLESNNSKKNQQIEQDDSSNPQSSDKKDNSTNTEAESYKSTVESSDLSVEGANNKKDSKIIVNTNEDKPLYGLTEEEINRFQSIRQAQREVFQSSQYIKNANEVSPFIPTSKSIVAQPYAPKPPTLRLDERAQFPASFFFKEAALYLVEKNPDIQTQKARQHLFVFYCLASAILIVVVLSFFLNDEGTAIYANLNHTFANATFVSFFTERFHIDRMKGFYTWIHQWLEDKFDPFCLLMLGEEEGVGRKWLLKSYLRERKQVLQIELGNGEASVFREILKTAFGRIEKHINEMPSQLINKGLQYISFSCSDEISPSAIIVLDMTKVELKYFEDRFWEVIDMFHESNDLYPQEIVQAHRGGMDVNSYISSLNPKPYVGLPKDSRFNTGLKIIILANLDQFNTVDQVKACTFTHFLVVPRFTEFEANQFLSKRGILLGQDETIRKIMFENYPEIGLNPKELFRFSNVVERQSRQQRNLIEKRRQLKKQMSILKNIELTRDHEALTETKEKNKTETLEGGIFTTINEDVLKYTDDERKLHIEVLQEELNDIRSQILPQNALIENYLKSRREYLKEKKLSLLHKDDS